MLHGQHVPDGVIALELTDGPRLVIDGKPIPASVGTGDAPADVTVSLTTATLGGLLDGSVDPQAAFMSGDLKVAGDMGMAMELAGLFAQ
jgi:putative sterol carrier protein